MDKVKKSDVKKIPNPDGRPIQNGIEPINDTPENVAKIIMKRIMTDRKLGEF